MVACTSLINSSLSEYVEWILIDSTANTNRPRNFGLRAFAALKRMVQFQFKLWVNQPDAVLLFCSTGFSFREKSWMARRAKKKGRIVILAPRSGLIKDDIEKSESFKKIVIESLNTIDVLLCQGPSWKLFYSQLSLNKSLQYEVIHNWIDISSYRDQKKSEKKDSKFVVLFVGWITRNKGIFEILEVARRITDTKVEFVLAGDGDVFEEVAELIKKERITNVKLTGWVKGGAKDKLMAGADIFILPSYREGYPNALIEAMASGLPVVSTKVGSIPDLIENRKSGILIDPKSADQLEIAIRELLDDESGRKRMGKNARQRVFENNTIEIAVGKFQKLLT